jgi:hypothetical protein
MTEFVVDSEYTLCCFVANGRSILGIEDCLEDDRHPLPLAAAHAVATNGVNQWNWRDTSTNGTNLHICKLN